MTSSKKTVSQNNAIKLFEYMSNALVKRTSPMHFPGMHIKYKLFDLDSLLFWMLVDIDGNNIEFKDNKQYLLEEVFPEAMYAKITAAYYGHPDSSPDLTMFFNMCGLVKEEERFWQRMKSISVVFPDPLMRLRAILLAVSVGGDPLNLMYP